MVTLARLLPLMAVLSAAGLAGAQVVLNEIHYNPLGPDDLEEFLELHNAGPDPVDLSGWAFSDGVQFVFPPGTMIAPGGFAVVARDPAALEAATGYADAFQWTSGALDNGGERVAISDAFENLVDEVDYGDGDPWPDAPDGDGPSLELIHYEFPNDSARMWGAALLVNGTPGAANSILDSSPRVLTEVPERGAGISGLPAVTVTFAEPVTGVSAGDLTVDGSPALSVAGSGAGPYEFAGFAAPQGRAVDVVLSPGTIQDDLGNPFAGDGWSYTLAIPRVVINEIHYHPDESQYPNQEVEFFELYNADASTVDLSGWMITDGVEFTFPDGSTIAPAGFVVVAVDPVALEAATGYSGALQWSSGALSNGGERLAISNSLGTLIDEVTYGDGGTWPGEPDGDGPSLELVNPGLRNDIPQSWAASLLVNGTPGEINSVFEDAPAPVIFGPVHEPAIPSSIEEVRVSVNVLDDAPMPPLVTLHYRVDEDPPLPYSSVAMLDDGQNGDGDPDDQRFGVVLPPLADGQKYDFYVTADDGQKVAAAPTGHEIADDYGNPSQTFLCKFSDEVLPADFPVYHVLVTRVNENIQSQLPFGDAKTQFDATFIDANGKVYYNVRERYRGQSSLLRLPHSYRIDFAADQLLDSEFGFPVRALQLNSQHPMRQELGWQVSAAAGLAVPVRQFIRLRFNAVNYDNSNIFANDNGFAGVYLAVERIDDDFLDSQGGLVDPDRGFDADGNLYRGENSATLDYRGEDPDPYRTDSNGQFGYEKVTNENEDDWEDLITLCDVLNNTNDDDFPGAVAALVDEDKWSLWFAVHMLFANKEGGLYRDTGDDYFLYFSRDPLDYGATLLSWDLDSVMRGVNETIWRTTVPAPQRFLRHNAFAPIFVKALRDLLDTEFSVTAMNARIDAMPDAVFAASGGSDAVPLTKQQFKNWVAARIAFIDDEIVPALTLDLGGIPTEPYNGPDPVLKIGGELNQAGTHNVKVNGRPTQFSVFQGTWSADHWLRRGVNGIEVQSFDRHGDELERISQYIYYEPPPASLRVSGPTRMVNDKTITLQAELLEVSGGRDWRVWDALGTITATRVSDNSDVPLSIVVFDTHDGTPPEDSLRFYNGVGTVSLVLDNGLGEAPGDVRFTVNAAGASGSMLVTLLDGGAPGLYTELSGVLSGSDLVWGPDDGVIRLTGDCTVPAGQTLQIGPGTLVMADAGAPNAGVGVHVQGRVLALGTATAPIYMFPSAGPAAMALENSQDSNYNSWRGLRHTSGNETSIYEHVFIAGGGNGPPESHPRPSVLGFRNGHSLRMRSCVMADNPGKCLSGSQSGDFRVFDSVFSRNGHGQEWGLGEYSLLVENCWFTGLGHGPESLNLDGDCINIRESTSPSLRVRGCMLTDGGDDGVDTLLTSPVVEDSIIYGMRDKAVSLGESGSPSLRNLLIFDCAVGIRIEAGHEVQIENCTISGALQPPISNAGMGLVTKSIIWPQQFNTCGALATTYCNVGTGSNISCGEGNIDTDPLLVDVNARRFELKLDSPARSAGPDGGPIGWRGSLSRARPGKPGAAPLVPVEIRPR